MAEAAVGELRGGVARKLAHVTALLAHTQGAMSRLDTHEVSPAQRGFSRF